MSGFSPPMSRMSRGRSSRLKRIIDIIASIVGLVTMSPILIGIAFAILITMGRPVLFRQERPGLDGAEFVILKFRTMTMALDEHGKILPDESRITSLGSWLRHSSLDELPELINVLRGEMSLVGPRPLLIEYLDRYSPTQARRMVVRPGITGLAQVSGRNAISWDEKFALDVCYVDNWSLRLDIEILLRTISKVVSREGISAEGHATAPPFLGPGRTDKGTSDKV